MTLRSGDEQTPHPGRGDRLAWRRGLEAKRSTARQIGFGSCLTFNLQLGDVELKTSLEEIFRASVVDEISFSTSMVALED